MATSLSWYPRPRVDTGLGFHDSSQVGANPPNIEAHAKALRAAGISWYKILEAGGNKVERCRIYLEHDIMPIVRLYIERPHPDYIVYPGQVAAYTRVGVRYFEMGNEPNISEAEWVVGKWPSAADMGRIIAEQWLKAADMVKREGGIPLVYAMTPEGTYAHAGGHRRITIDFLQHLKLKQPDALEGAGVAIHPRPHNNPPDTPSTATNTVTFREYEWYARTYQELIGWIPPLFATEHGYSMGDSQNANFPRIDEPRWVDYNQELFERMNPSHQKAIPPHLFCLCYWLETIGGDWPNDELSRGWFPDGLRPWGARIAQMRVTWDREVPVAPRPEIPMPTIPPKPPHEWLSSPNYATIPNRDVNTILWHHTGGSARASIAHFQNDASDISAHYLVTKAGKTYQFVRDENVAWHAGYSRMPDGRENVNLFSIGIEVENAGDGKDPYPQVQIDALIALGKHLAGKHGIIRAGNVTHELVRRLWKEHHPGRSDVGYKTDPRGLDMVKLLDRIYGVPAPAPVPIAPIDSLIELAKDKAMQLISPNWDAAIAKSAVKAGYTAPLGNELTFKEWVFQLWGKPGSKAEAVFYVLKGDWGNVRFKAL